MLKIDRSFIIGIEKDVESREIAHLIVTLAHHLASESYRRGHRNAASSDLSWSNSAASSGKAIFSRIPCGTTSSKTS